MTTHHNAPPSLQDGLGGVLVRTARQIRAKAAYKALVKRRTKELRDYKESNGCRNCGETHPACLDFHHRDPSTKLFTIGNSSKACKSKERVWAEVAKCDVVCSNCHRKEHYNHLTAQVKG